MRVGSSEAEECRISKIVIELWHNDRAEAKIVTVVTCIHALLKAFCIYLIYRERVLRFKTQILIPQEIDVVIMDS